MRTKGECLKPLRHHRHHHPLVTCQPWRAFVGNFQDVMYCAGCGHFGRVDIDVADVFCAFHVVIFTVSTRLRVTHPKIRKIVAIGVVIVCGIKTKPKSTADDCRLF